MLSIALTFMFTSVGMQQNAKAQAVEQGNVIIDAYYGWPNLYTTVMKTAYNLGGESDVKIKGVGPLGGRVEYMVAERIGMGVEVNFAQSSLDWTDNNSGENYTYSVSSNRLRALLRFNYHFAGSDKFDSYFAVGAGYKNTSITAKSTDPNFEEASLSGLIPVATRIGVGGRYYFTDNIGLSAEIGLGGPLVSAGLTVKL